MAYYAEYYKMNNQELLNLLAETLNRSKSSVVRKMNRLRAVHTGKAKYASDVDIECATLMRSLDEYHGRLVRSESLRSLLIPMDKFTVDEFKSNRISRLSV